MTEIPPSMEHTTPLAVFLSSVCPGLPVLDNNIHFSLNSLLSASHLKSIENFNWPLTGPKASVAVKARLDHTYLNVARPPFQQDLHRNIESTTYVPLPLHYTSLFQRLVADNGDQKQDGTKHVGANVNPLLHDPYHSLQLNPGCLSSMMSLHNETSSAGQYAPELRNSFNKMTSSINKLLRIGISEPHHAAHWQSLPSEVDRDPTSSTLKGQSHKKDIISSLIDFDQKQYFSQVTSPTTAKLLVSVNVNVVNVFAIGQNNEFLGTTVMQSTSQLFTQAEASNAPSVRSSSASSSLTHSLSMPYRKVIERPILRLKLASHLQVTSMITTSSGMLVIMGLNNGNILIVNLNSLTFRYFDDFGNHNPNGSTDLLSTEAITSLCAVCHPSHPLLIFAGYATGEIVILDPDGAPKSLEGPYLKTVVGSDRFITYFKTFDLSGWLKSNNSVADGLSPEYLIGHFKISLKPITAITSTIPHECTLNNSHRPMIVAFASEDGLVRFVDLVATYGQNFGNLNDFYNLSILTDIVSNYFQDGVRDIAFSPDNKLFVSCGKGDLVEIFKMSYYNVNALLRKDCRSGVREHRSRSGTLNSVNSSNPHLLASNVGYLSSPSSFDLPRAGASEAYFAPAIKDIAIVSRLKGHLNIVKGISFVTKDQYFYQNDAFLGNYNLISCGNDGKVNFWDFDKKALPKVKKSHFTTNARRLPQHFTETPVVAHVLSISSRAMPPASQNGTRTHKSHRSLTSVDDFQLNSSVSKIGISNLLSASSPASPPPDNSDEHLQIVFSLYRSLYEMRLRKHYAKQKKELKGRYSCVIHEITNDKNLPSIQVPLLTMDLSSLLNGGQISGYHCDSRDFWIYGKSGDIFRYKIGL